MILFSWQWVKLFRHATPTKCAHWIAFTPPFSDEGPAKAKDSQHSQNSTFMKYQNHGPWCYSGSCTWHHDGLTQQEFPTLHRWTLPSLGPPCPAPLGPGLQPIWWPTALSLAVLDQAQQWQRALELLGELPRRGIQASCAAINSAMACCEPCFKMGAVGSVEVRWRQGWR